jgi:CP family cyanate transporter-like MFS transporter
LALFLSALALRPQIVGVGPILPQIQGDLGVSHAVAGLLGTIPLLCMGLFAPFAAVLSSAVGSRVAIAAAVALIGVAGIARALLPGIGPVLALTFPVGIGIAVAGTLLPVAVKERFIDRPAISTGIYTTGINVGSAIAAAAAVPIAALGSWRTALLVFSAATAILAALWFLQTRAEPRPARARVQLPMLPWRNPVAWTLVGIFSLLGTSYYGLNAWLPDSYVERGWSEHSAGALLGVLNIVSIPAGLVIAALAERYGSRRRNLIACGALILVAALGIVLVPSAAWLWAALYGGINGGAFALIMTLPLDVADRPEEVGAAAGMVLGVGYTLTALSPLVLGAVRDATGSFTGSLWIVVGAVAAFLVLAATLSPARLAHRCAHPGHVPGERAGGVA